MAKRIQIKINGQVQGVGFRPYIYQTARQLKLSGWVRNDADGITLQTQGELVSQFIPTLLANLPALVKIKTIKTCTLPFVSEEKTFTIIASQRGKINTIISPDAAICSACLSELFDPNSRFYGYPFLNCMHCGPRLTITQQLPYDRCHTSMNQFSLCSQCKKEYTNPNNRRYHAQPTACQECGPKLSIAIENLAYRINNGEIIAVKGLGGYQLIADAKNSTAITKLRARKQREEKPFALMMLNVKSIKSIAECNAQEEQLLTCPMRPIVLLRKKANINLISNHIAPSLTHIGIMLPYTALHYLLFNMLAGSPQDAKEWLQEENASLLVVTSANSRDDPLLIDNTQALQKLAHIADYVVSYNRDIVTRVDDSVLRIINQAPCFIRRARGYVPTSIQLAHFVPSILGVGAYLKNTVCITRNDEAFLSQHIGDLQNKETIKFFHETIIHLLKFLNVKPEGIAYDCHPDLYTSQFAEQYGLPAIKVLHHHAHLAAVAAEYHIQEPVLGLALDGHGFGLQGENWGGELLLLNRSQCERLANLKPVALPGGDRAAREPWRMGVSILHHLGFDVPIIGQLIKHPQVPLLIHMLKNQINTPVTSSCGRLFDAAAALLGVHLELQYEGQAAMKLESLVTQPETMQNGWIIEDHTLSLLPLLKQLITLDPISGANLFHGTLIAALHDWIITWSKKTQINTILLSGGCFINKILTEGITELLTACGIEVLFPKQAPPNDAGISLGQAWIAGLLCV